MFGPGGFQGRLRAYPFLGTWRALLCGEVMRVGAPGDDLQRLFGESTIQDSKTFRSDTGEIFMSYV